MDLHTKRTGHAEFTDKTSETAKPIDLENATKSHGGTEESALEGESSQSEGMFCFNDLEVHCFWIEEKVAIGFGQLIWYLHLL